MKRHYRTRYNRATGRTEVLVGQQWKPLQPERKANAIRALKKRPSGGGTGGTLTPAASVVTETTAGQASAVGTSLDYARADHTHGTPASGGGLTNGTATLDFGAAPGTSATSVDVATPVGAGNLAIASLQYEASADHNAEEHALLAGYVGLTAYRSALNTLTIMARTELRLTGEVTVRWAWSA